MSLLAQVAPATPDAGAEAIMFWILAVLAVGSGLAVVTMRNIVHGALMLVLNFLCIAGLYLGLQSSFLSIVQVIVYAGAIVVLFLFVIMLLGVDRDDLLGTTSPVRTVAAVLAGLALAGALLAVVGATTLTDGSLCGGQVVVTEEVTDATACVGLDDALAEQDSVEFVASRLFTRWTVPFEIAALLLVVATLGALVLGRRHDEAVEDDLVPTAPLPDLEDVAEVAARQAAEAADAADAEALLADEGDVLVETEPTADGDATDTTDEDA